MNTPSEIYVKEYDTLRISGEYKNNNGEPLSLEGVTIESTMRSLNNRYEHILSIELSDVAQGKFVLTSDAVRFVPTVYKVDVSFFEVSSGNRVTSETFNVNVLQSVTHPAGVMP